MDVLEKVLMLKHFFLFFKGVHNLSIGTIATELLHAFVNGVLDC